MSRKATAGDGPGLARRRPLASHGTSLSGTPRVGPGDVAPAYFNWSSARSNRRQAVGRGCLALTVSGSRRSRAVSPGASWRPLRFREQDGDPGRSERACPLRVSGGPVPAVLGGGGVVLVRRWAGARAGLCRRAREARGSTLAGVTARSPTGAGAGVLARRTSDRAPGAGRTALITRGRDYPDVVRAAGGQAPSARSSGDGFHSSPTAIVRPGQPGASTVVSPSASAATT